MEAFVVRKAGPKVNGATVSRPILSSSSSLAQTKERSKVTGEKNSRKRQTSSTELSRSNKRPSVLKTTYTVEKTETNTDHAAMKTKTLIVETCESDTSSKPLVKSGLTKEAEKQQKQQEQANAEDAITNKEEHEGKEKQQSGQGKQRNDTVVEDFSWLDDFQVPVAFRGHIDALSEWFLSAVSYSKDILHCEIEGKIGSFSVTRKQFESIVQPEHFNAQLARCQRAAASTSLNVFDRTETETTITFMFSNGVRGTQYRDQRSEFVRKRRVSNWDIAFGEKSQRDGKQCCVRLSHNVEEPCEPPCEQVKWVRVRKRHSFYYRKVWRFDFTYVRQGASRSEAIAAPLQHEIEIEYVGGEIDFSHHQNRESVRKQYAQYLVCSLLLKLHDMLALSNERKPNVLSILQHIVKED